MSAVHPCQLPALISSAIADGIKLLSLDCFDTLLWRLTHRPIDVFAAPNLALRPSARIHAEHEARRLRQMRDGRSEVRIEDIYARAFDSADRVCEAVAAELAAEHAHCYAFAPTVELIRAARAAGLRVVIVSDTYLSEAQLRALITAAVGADIVALIERIYCSSEHGVSKAGGLFKSVLEDLKLPPQQILHVGDNRIADLESAGKLGLHARHLEQFDPSIEQQLRQEANIAALFDPPSRAPRPIYQPQRALLARGVGPQSPAAERLGYAVLGPILFGFAHWVRAEARRWANDGSKPKLLFVMRDGHLPLQAYRAIASPEDATAHAIELSRFTAFATALRSSSDIDEYLAENLPSWRFRAMARQLHFTEAEAQALEHKALRAADPARAFAQRIRGPQNTQLILSRAARMRARLVAHLRKAADVNAGDRVMLVDLGYAGTVQNRVEPFLREELGLQVRGAYLLLRDLPDRYASKRGFISSESVDGRAIDALCDFIALFEQLCAVTQGSVIDYTEQGAPVRKDSGLASRQSAVRVEAQTGCLRFVADALAQAPTGAIDPSPEALRQSSMAALARLLFLPTAEELDLLKGFEHDINLGVDDKVLLFDAAACRQGLRDRGLFYVNDNPRQFLPAELRAFGLPLTLTLLAQRRFGLDLRASDFAFERIALPVMVANTAGPSLAQIDAIPTHDGFYLARIPIGRCEYAIGVLFGRAYECIELASATVTRNDMLLGAGDLTQAHDVLAAAHHELAELGSDGLLRLQQPAAFSFFPPPTLDRRFLYTLNVVFRPLRARVTAAAAEAPTPAAAMA